MNVFDASEYKLQNMQNILGRLCLVAFLIITSNNLFAQVFDTIRYQAKFLQTGATNAYQPHYIHVNQFGVLDFDRQFQTLIRAAVEKPFSDSKKFDVALGLDLVADDDISQSFAQQFYAKLKYGPIQLAAGKWQQTIGEQYDPLSTGSLIMSQNARPLTRISIGIPEYAAVPLTFGYLEVKGELTHGWFEEDRFVESPLMHGKYMYLRGGGKLPVNLSAGLVHFAQWGGTHPDDNIGKISTSFSDFRKVFFGQGGGSGGEAVNALGNHLGIVDLGILVKLKQLNINIYHQYPYEDQSNVHTIFLTNFDRLLGLQITNKSSQPSFLSNILYEFITSKHQSGRGLPDPTSTYPDKEANYGYDFRGRDDFYNNYLYESGWTFAGRVIGTPLVQTNQIITNYLGEISDTYGIVVNNRIVGHHLGLEGDFSSRLSYRMLSTYTHNHGTYAGANKGRFNWASREDPDFDYEFEGGLSQWYFLAEVQVKSFLHPDLRLSTSMGFDVGQMTDNVGLLLSLHWDGFWDL